MVRERNCGDGILLVDLAMDRSKRDSLSHPSAVQFWIHAPKKNRDLRLQMEYAFESVGRSSCECVMCDMYRPEIETPH